MRSDPPPSSAPKGRVLVADDHPEMALVLADQLQDAGYEVETVSGGEAAIEALRHRPFALVITDLRMAGSDGFDVLDVARRLEPPVPVIIMTAFGAVESAVEAMRRGAFHYLAKPFRLDEVLIFVERALADRRLRLEHQQLKRLAVDRSSLAAMVGRSPRMLALFDLVARVAPADVPVLIRGESGSGKELVARALHFEGVRRDGPFVAVNVTTIPDALLESELFGHLRGAYTGASATRRGLFVEADGGTLFLDEIGDMPLELQTKLLRVLEGGEIRPVGADAARRVDVRIVAATHQPLEERVREGRFRADLFYRLDVVQVRVPPLRERLDDIPLLLEHFLARARQQNPSAQLTRFSPRAVAALAQRPWPGNVRELESLVRRMMVLCPKSVAELEDLEADAPSSRDGADGPGFARDPLLTLRQLEDEYIGWVLRRCEGNKTRAAELLGIDVSTIHRREKARG